MKAERVAAAALALLGLSAVLYAWRLPYWIDRSPGPGFLPLWLGVLLTACAASVFVRSRPVSPADRLEPLELRPAAIPEALALAAITTAAAASVPLIGLIPATALLTAAATWRLAPRRPIANAAATILTPVAVWLVFVRWLGMPLP